jgi:2,4-dienoyl-CoA reductase-like NADH-dependent reductase (Old Yellow Enzyme family)
MMPGERRVFTSYRIGSVTLRNRVIRSAAFENMCPDGVPGDALLEYHRKVAAGGVAMTTVAYAAVSADGLTYPNQINTQREEVWPGLRRLTDAVHAEGSAACIQLGHAGYFAEKKVIGTKPMGASRVFNTYGLAYPRVMNAADISDVAERFARAAWRAQESGFDTVEIQAGHGYLLSQFLSPYTNRRRDTYGGSLANRLRLPVDVLREVRKAVRPGFPVLVKMNLRDGFRGGLELDEAVEVARRFEAEGADALILSGGFVSKTPMYILRGDVPYREFRRGQDHWTAKLGLLLMGRLVIKKFPFEEAYFLQEARRVRAAVGLPLVLVGGLRRLSTLQAVVQEGFDLVAMARPLIMEPDLVRRMEKGEAEASRCQPCNLCVADMNDDETGMRCTLMDKSGVTGG